MYNNNGYLIRKQNVVKIKNGRRMIFICHFAHSQSFLPNWFQHYTIHVKYGRNAFLMKGISIFIRCSWNVRNAEVVVHQLC